MNRNIIILIILIIVIRLMIKNKKTIINKYNNMKQIYSDETLQLVFNKLKQKYPVEILKNAERIFRLETRHFTSGGLRLTNGAGMQATTNDFPYGWYSMKQFWLNNQYASPERISYIRENKQPDIAGSGKIQMFLVFSDILAGIETLCYWLSINKNNAGRWFSTDKSKQESYTAKINQISTKYV